MQIKKNGRINIYSEADHSIELKGHDTWNDSRVIEARTLEEAKENYWIQFDQEHGFEEYSSTARINIDSIDLIDDVVEDSEIKASDPKDMPLRQCGHLEYSFTEEEAEYLTTENTYVIDNLIGVYGKELKLNRDGLIKLNKKNSWFSGC